MVCYRGEAVNYTQRLSRSCMMFALILLVTMWAGRVGW
jgi:hypothetical protein